MINRKFVYILICFLHTIPGMAQIFDVNLEEVKAKYKGENLVYLKYNKTFIIEPNGKELSIKDETENVYMYLSDKAAIYANEAISYVDAYAKIEKIEAYSMIPKENGDYKKVKVEEIIDRKNTSEDVFYDDVHVKSFTFPQPQKYAIAVLKYTEITTDPHFLGRYYFGSSFPIEHAEFKVKVHQDVVFKFKLMNPNIDINFTETKEGKYVIYQWKRSNIKKLEYESEAKAVTYDLPHVVCYIASYKLKNKEVQVLTNTKELYNYCYSLLERGIEKPDQEIARVTDSLIKDVSDSAIKIQRIYNFVQEKIKYIAIEDGMGGYIPRKPSLVFTRKYGDCKDLSNLLCTMLNYAGIPTYHTWIGTNTIPYKFSEVPIMGVANHMIAAVRLHNQWYFLDGTAKFLTFKYPSDFVQGKQAMIGIGADSFALVDIPIINAETNQTTDVYQISLSGDTIFGEAVKTIDGLPRCNLMSSIYYVSINKLKEYWENFLKLGQNNCKIDNIAITGTNGRDSLLKFNYSYKIPNYITKIDNERYLNMNLVRLWEHTDVEIEKRKREYIFDNTKSNKITTIFNIPVGYEVVELPPDIVVDKGDFGFKFNYIRKGNTIVYQQYFWFNKLDLKKSDFQTWNDLIEQLHKAYRKNISIRPILKK